MDNKQSLLSAALLEAIWASRKKDMIDLITPFILFAIARETSPDNAVNTKSVLRYVQEKYAYPDLPEAIIKSALARNPYRAFELKNGVYYLKKSIDDIVQEMERRERECSDSIVSIGKELSQYLSVHCQKTKSVSPEEAINRLHSFFARYGLEVGTEALASVEIKPKEYEIDYYIARFIFEHKDENDSFYKKIIDLVKGFYLRLALYIQPQNGNIQSASFANVNFLIDTPVLIDLLGYQGAERAECALSLHRMLKRQNANLFYLYNVKREVINILTAYKHSLIPGGTYDSSKTLEGLDERNFDVSDVEREIELLASKLESSYCILEKPTPAYATKEDNTVDEAQVLGEEEIKQYIRDNTKHYSKDNLDSDVSSVLAIHKLRGGKCSNNIESSGYVFVTNNGDFVRAFNKYYRDNVCNETFPLAITFDTLAAISWIKCGEVEKVSESVLLKNAYCAMQPIPEMLSKLEEVLMKMKDSGLLTLEQVVALRANRVFQKGLWKNTFGELEAVNEYSVSKAKEDYDLSVVEQEKKAHENEIEKIKSVHREKEIMHEKALRDEQLRYSEYVNRRNHNDELQMKKQMERFRKSADSIAKDARTRWFEQRMRAIKTICWMLVLLGVSALVITFSVADSLWLTVLTCMGFLLSAVSVYDTVFSRKPIIASWLEKKSYNYETEIREEKLREYTQLLQKKEDVEEVLESELIGI